MNKSKLNSLLSSVYVLNIRKVISDSQNKLLLFNRDHILVIYTDILYPNAPWVTHHLNVH